MAARHPTVHGGDSEQGGSGREAFGGAEEADDESSERVFYGQGSRMSSLRVVDETRVGVFNAAKGLMSTYNLLRRVFVGV